MHSVLHKMEGPSSIPERKMPTVRLYGLHILSAAPTPHCITRMFWTQIVAFHHMGLRSGNAHLHLHLLLKTLLWTSRCCHRFAAGPDRGPTLVKWNTGSQLVSSETLNVTWGRGGVWDWLWVARVAVSEERQSVVGGKRRKPGVWTWKSVLTCPGTRAGRPRKTSCDLARLTCSCWHIGRACLQSGLLQMEGCSCK